MISVTNVSGHLAGKTEMVIYFNYTLKPGNEAVVREAVVCFIAMENRKSPRYYILPSPR